jgi:hypothetical protein
MFRAKPATGPWAHINKPTAGPQKKAELPRGQHPLQLYSLGTPNGVKVTICLEELAEVYPNFEYDAWLTKIDGAQVCLRGAYSFVLYVSVYVSCSVDVQLF